MLKLDLTKKALAFLDKLPPKQFRQVARKIFSLMSDPLPADSKQLQGYSYRRTDIGEYRIIYYRDGDTVKVPIIVKRNDGEVYRKLK